MSDQYLQGSFADIGLQRLEDNEAFYYNLIKSREFDGLISNRVDDFNILGNIYSLIW